MHDAPPPVVVRTKAMIAHDVATRHKMSGWEERELARLSRPSLLALARVAIPGYREVVEAAPEANR